MFVRTKKGKIFDCYVSEQMGKPIYYSKNSKTNGYIDWNEVYKKSENIIDILEEGDYVNGCRVEEHAHEKGRLFVTYTYIGGKGFTTYEDYSWELAKDREEDIKSIVTKEMMESVSYYVK